ncbi:MAG: VanZ family protein [Thermodesulfobacteriota bacterium]|nr:VanZ family protein [Thermodesulfobacteriota bacterium]
MAYTDLPNIKIERDVSEYDSFSIEIAIKPEPFNQNGFNFILAFHDGSDRNQLLVGQYRSCLIIMNGDDYSNRRKTKRIVVNKVFKSPKEIFLAITTGPEGTKAYIDGLLMKEKKDLILKIPQGRDSSRLILGNSVYGNNFWKGDIFGLAFYVYELTSEQVELHYNAWSKDRRFSYANQYKPSLLYLFDEKNGEMAIDHANGNHELKIPTRMHLLKRRILTLPWIDLRLNKSFIQDFVINLAGFIPLAFILSVTFIELGGTLKKRVILITVALCFAISLIIEVAQGWIPSRSSQILDLMLNTGGALIGASTYKAIVMDKNPV